MKPLHLTFIQAAIGHRPGQSYLKTWCMEPLGMAVLAALTPRDIPLSFYDDRIEPIPYDNPTDAVFIGVETYTARRCYEIASGYRKRGVPVIMGGFHATAVPEETERFADATVIGEAETIWLHLLDDLRHRTLQRRYSAERPMSFSIEEPRREIFKGKRYLPVTLMETGRGCTYGCDFCSIQCFYSRTYRKRPVDSILEEIQKVAGRGHLIFFVDDNFSHDPHAATALLTALEKHKLRWVTQIDMNTARNGDLLAHMRRAGCGGALIGFESINASVLRGMKKGVNLINGGFEPALSALKQANMGVFATFVFGRDEDTESAFEETLEFALQNRFFLAAFNQLMPFPSTPLYRRLREERRLRFDPWWLDAAYSFNTVPYTPLHMSAEELSLRCLDLRKRFYSLGNILRRSLSRQHWKNLITAKGYFPLNILHRAEARRRYAHPLGDASFEGPLLEVQ